MAPSSPPAEPSTRAELLRAGLKRWYAAGRSHGIPPCCSARFAVDAEMVLPRLSSPVATRVRRLLPRYAVAIQWGAGVVPCEGHLLLWLLSGRRPACAREQRPDHLGE